MFASIRCLSPVPLAGFVPLSAAAQDTKEFKFTNKNSANADDLHVELDGQVSGRAQQTPSNTFAHTNGSGTHTMNFAQGHSGSGVVRSGRSSALEFRLPARARGVVLALDGVCE
jgi:hypothetical protein